MHLSRKDQIVFNYFSEFPLSCGTFEFVPSTNIATMYARAHTNRKRGRVCNFCDMFAMQCICVEVIILVFVFKWVNGSTIYGMLFKTIFKSLF